MWRYKRGQRPSSCPQGACKYSSWLESRCPVRSAEGCRAVQGGAGQGVHMPKKNILTVQDLYYVCGRIPAHLSSKIAPTRKVIYEVGSSSPRCC